MIIEKKDGEWALYDDVGGTMRVSENDLMFLHKEIQEKLISEQENPAYTFTFFDKQDVQRTLHAIDYLLILCKLEEQYRTWYKWGVNEGETFDIDLVRDHFYETLGDYHIDVFDELN